METKITKQDLENRFSCHAISDEQNALCDQIRKSALQLAKKINKGCPDSREKSIAMTKLEEVVVWANSSVARNA